MEKKLPPYPGRFSATFSGTVGLPPVGNSDVVVFWPVLGGGHLGKFRARSKTEKHDFPELGALLEKTTGRNFFTFCVLTDRREITKYWGFRPFWPRAAPWHLEKFRVENRKTRFPGARGTFGKKTGRPQIFSQKLRNFFTLCVLTDPTPRGRKSQNTGFSGPSGLGQPLGT